MPRILIVTPAIYPHLVYFTEKLNFTLKVDQLNLKFQTEFNQKLRQIDQGVLQVMIGQIKQTVRETEITTLYIRIIYHRRTQRGRVDCRRSPPPHHQ